MFINNTQRRINDTQCEYTNTRTSNAKIYMNPTLGKEVGEINPPKTQPQGSNRRKGGGMVRPNKINNEVQHWVRE